jgi:hypothetical protein
MDRRHLAALAMMGTLLLPGGCASLIPGNCERFADERKKTDYTTRYRLSEAHSQDGARQHPPLPRGQAAMARVYRVGMSSRDTHTCRHIMIEKDVYLQRMPGGGLVLEEVREIYAAGGGRIATRTENVTAQLARTGYYQAEVAFPIPEKTPPGTYRVVSRLLLRGRGPGAVPLGQAETSFTVLARR